MTQKVKEILRRRSSQAPKRLLGSMIDSRLVHEIGAYTLGDRSEGLQRTVNRFNQPDCQEQAVRNSMSMTCRGSCLDTRTLPNSKGCEGFPTCPTLMTFLQGFCVSAGFCFIALFCLMIEIAPVY